MMDSSNSLENLKRSRVGLESHMSRRANDLIRLMEYTMNINLAVSAKNEFDTAFTKCIEMCEHYRDVIPDDESWGNSKAEAIVKCSDILTKQTDLEKLFEQYLERCSKDASFVPETSVVRKIATPSKKSSSRRLSVSSNSSSVSSGSSSKSTRNARTLKEELQKMEKQVEIKKKLMEVEFQRNKIEMELKVLRAQLKVKEAELPKDYLDADVTIDTARKSSNKSESVGNPQTAHSSVKLGGSGAVTSEPAEYFPRSSISLPVPSAEGGLSKVAGPQHSVPPFPTSHVNRANELSMSSRTQQHPFIRVDKRREPNIIYNEPDKNDFIEAMRLMASTIRQGFSLPKRELEVFDGSPLNYHEFICNFDANIEGQSLDAESKLTYLIQQTSGKAYRAIKPCRIIKPPEEAYLRARYILREKFGQRHIVAGEFIKTLTEGPPLRPNDLNALDELSTKMQNCEITLGEWGYQNSLNNQEDLGKIFARLPKYLQAEYTKITERIYDAGSEPNFSDMSQFVRKKVANSNTMYGRILSGNDESKPNKTKLKWHKKPQISTFSLQSRTDEPKAAVGLQRNLRNCSCCETSQIHPLWKCGKFQKMEPRDRVRFIRNQKLCFNCLSGKHFAYTCKNINVCRVNGCGRKHHTLLHIIYQNKNSSSTTEEPEPAQSENLPVTMAGVTSEPISRKVNCSDTHKFGVRLKVLPVEVWSGNKSRSVKTYAFLDEGSNSSLCTNALIAEMGVKGDDCEFSVTTVTGQTKLSGHSVSLTVRGLCENDAILIPRVLTVKELPDLKSNIPSVKDVLKYPYLENIHFPEVENKCVKILIGADIPEAHDVLEVRRGGIGQPRAVHSPLGWTLVGPEYDQKDPAVRIHLIHQDNQFLHQQMMKMYDHDFQDPIGISGTSLSQEDQRALAIMQGSIEKVSGHYQIALPWKFDNVVLPNNRLAAERRLFYLKKRFERDPELFQQYCDKMNEYFENGYARRIPEEELALSSRTWYIPHHATRGKFRIVFDCSAKFQNTSLNDQLLQGPDFANNLTGVLLRFRQERVALVADIKGMFHQVLVEPKDCDSLRFLWWPNNDLTKPPESYQMLRHLFGASSSPSCASFALKQIAIDNETDACQETLDAINKSFYVDDFLKSLDSVSRMISLKNELSLALKHGGFSINKYLSNDQELLNNIPESERASSVKNLDLDKLPTEKVLGVHWDADNDMLKVHVNIKPKPSTRRGILSMVSQVYDPIGFVQPFLLPVKKLMQSLCIQNLGWDEKIESVQEDTWNDWVTTLPQLESLEISRCYKSLDSGKPVNIQLHHFCDASASGYGAVSYLRITDENNDVQCAFVMGKSRVTPIKSITIPRLELSAAVVGIKLNHFITSELEYPIDQVFFWTDSTSVLRYISNTSKRFHTFVANRLTLIHEGSTISQWRYVDSKQNPADISSRGLMPNELKKSKLWFDGPEFLQCEEKQWPVNPIKLSVLQDDDPELKSNVLHLAVNLNSKDHPLQELLLRYSSFGNLQKATAWLIRFKKYVLFKFSNQKCHLEPPKTSLTVDEIADATLDILRLVQFQCFPDAFANLRDHVNFKEKIDYKSKPQLKSTPSLRRLRKLSPIVVNGILRVGGRLQHSMLSEEMKHPIILPSTHHVTNLIVLFYHCREGHSGPIHVLAATREKYWILRGHSVVRRVLRSCMNCRIRKAGVGKQVMSQLPPSRITSGNPAFTSVAVDYMGPLLVKRGRGTEKRYGCIFTCMAVRAIHIEVANSLDTSSFINAYQRFINRRGRPREIFSDNGTNFVGAERELREGIEQWNRDQMDDTLRQQGIRWKFITQRASHHAGVVERMNRSVRKILRALVGERLLDDDSLNTFMTEIERILNDRPMTPVSDSADDFAALTPNSLLLGQINPSLPTDTFMKADGYKKSWRQVQWLSDMFWKRWIREYLPMLQIRQKWHDPQPNFKVGDLVLMLDENTKRGVWPKAIVDEVYPDRDGIVRRVKVRTSTSTYFRDIRKLCQLES